VPLLSAPTILVLRRWLSRRAVQALAIGTSLAVSGLGAALLVTARPGLAVYWFGGWLPRHGVALGVSFAVDSYGAAGVVLVGLITTAALVVAGPMAKFGAIAHSLTLVLLAAAAGFCLTGDLFNLFVFFELMTVCTIALCAVDTTDVRALRGALHFAVANTIGAVFVLIGVALLYARTGALNLASIGQRLTGHRPDQLVVTALALLTVGFLIKAAIVPFHFWLADTASVSPAPVSMLLVGVLDTLGLYALARIYWSVFAGAHGALSTFEPVLIGAGVVTAALGAALCLGEVDPPRRLAFVAISHSGLMLIAIGLLRPLGLAGFGLFACGDGAVKASLFALDAPRRAVAAGDPGGEARPRLTAPLLLLAGLALAGLPPAVTYLAKGLTESGTSGAGRVLLSGGVLVVSAVTGGAVVRLALARAGRPCSTTAA
jgi:multicomponent Na+:H+ antiporter subunit D